MTTSHSTGGPSSDAGPLRQALAGFGALYAAVAGLTLRGFEDLADRRAEGRAARAEGRATRAKGRTARAAKSKPRGVPSRRPRHSLKADKS